VTTEAVPATSSLRRWGQRIATFFRGPEGPPPPTPPSHASTRQRLASPIVVPARGHVFSFHIHASFLWTGDDVFEDDLQLLARSSMSSARRELRQIAADLARTREPQEARELEIEINRIAGKLGRWNYKRQGKTYRCRPYIRVELDERVKDQLMPIWERQIRLQGEHEVELRRARLAEERSIRWLEVLERLAEHPLAAAAARLTEEQLANVMDQVVTEQKDAVERLTTLLENTLRNASDLGAYERAETLDVLIDQLRARVAGRRSA